MSNETGIGRVMEHINDNIHRDKLIDDVVDILTVLELEDLETIYTTAQQMQQNRKRNGY